MSLFLSLKFYGRKFLQRNLEIRYKQRFNFCTIDIYSIKLPKQTGNEKNSHSAFMQPCIQPSTAVYIADCFHRGLCVLVFPPIHRHLSAPKCNCVICFFNPIRKATDSSLCKTAKTTAVYRQRFIQQFYIQLNCLLFPSIYQHKLLGQSHHQRVYHFVFESAAIPAGCVQYFLSFGDCAWRFCLHAYCNRLLFFPEKISLAARYSIKTHMAHWAAHCQPVPIFP